MGPSHRVGRGAKSVPSRRQIQRRKTIWSAAQIELPPGSNGNNVRFKSLPMTGELPWFNDWANIVVDHDGHMLYLYGGCRPNDNVQTSDFYCCDLETMEWSDLTSDLQFFPEPGDPFSNGPYKKPLPALRRPATTFLRMNGRKFILIFGGYKSKTVLSNLYAVDVDDLTWWAVRVEGGPVAARMCASIVAIETRLYLFGGLNTIYDSSAVLSFCVAEYSPDGHNWKWIVRDQPYPQHLPYLGFAVEAVPVYSGKKIMLTRGRMEETGRISLSSDTTILFHTTHHTFQMQTGTVGEFPQETTWYQLQNYSPPPKRLVSKFGLPPSHSRGIRNLTERLQGGSSTPRIAKPDTGSQSTTSFPLICAWIDHAGFLVPELWQYMLPPEERLCCLNIRERLFSLDLDLQMFIVSGSRLFFMGRAEENCPIWNVCVEMFLDGLV